MDCGGGAAARHVGPPRTLDVQQFAAARATEVQVLYNALKAQQEEGKLSLTTPRHLRRRTASHSRRPPFRWRSNAAQAGEKKKNEKKTNDKGNLESSSRTQGKIGPTAEEESSRKRKPEMRIPSRRVRRRIELQGVRDGSASCMGDGTRRLATHVWHAKRFPMTKVWGYCLPQGLPGRGRGSKAFLEWVKDAAVLHDASYIGLIELQGTQSAILRILAQTLEPPPGPPASGSRGKEEEIHGLLYGNAVLHNAGKAPLEAIAPVTILWRTSSSSEVVGTLELSTVGDGSGLERHLWIWVHPSAFDNALVTLSTACERQASDDFQSCVKCRTRSGDLARFDIFGKRALQVLQRVLRPIPRRLGYPSSSCREIASVGHQDLKTDVTTTASPDVSQILTARIFANADCLPAGTVLALDVYDPRDTPRSFYSGTNINLSQRAPDGIDDSNLPSESLSSRNYPMDEAGALQDRKPLVDSTENTSVAYWENLLERGLSKEVSYSPYLWSPQPERKLAALSQKAFSENRHNRRKSYFTGVEKHFLHSNLEERALHRRVEFSEACPVLLLKHAQSRASASGWSIILPNTWVQAFWVPLVFAGGHVIGLRERHWLATYAGLPYFPHDFPDCPAHAQHLAIENAAFNSANQARPPSKRSSCFAVSPLQRSIMYAYRGHMLNSSARTAAAVASEPIDEELGERPMEANCTTPAGVITRLTDVDVDTATTDAGSLVAREMSPPVGLIVASEFRNVNEDTDKAATGTKFTSLVVSSQGRENINGVNSPKPSPPLAEDSACLIELLPDINLSLEVAVHAIDGDILPEFANPEGDSPMIMIGTGSMISSSPVPLAACQIMDGLGIPEPTVPLGYNAVNEFSTSLRDSGPSLQVHTVDGYNPVNEVSTFLQDSGPCLQVHTVDGTLEPEFANPDADIEMPGIEGPVANASESPLPCQVVDLGFIPEVWSLKGDINPTVDGVISEAILKTDNVQTVDGVSLPELTKPFGDTAASQFKWSPDRVPPLAVPFHDDEATLADDDDATILDDFLQHGRTSSSAASQLEQSIFDVHETEKYNSGRCSLGETAIPAEEVIGSRRIEFHVLEVPEVVRNVTNFRSRDESFIPWPSSPGDHTRLGFNSTVKPTTGSSTLPLYVARTVEAVMKAFRGDGLQNPLLLCSGLMNCKSVQHGLRKGTLGWRACQAPVEASACTGKTNIHAKVGDHGKGCYVRVLIVVPRKGVLKENGLLCCPTKEDFDAFLSRSEHWQGVETSWLNPQAKELKKRKGKRKEKGQGKQKEVAAKSPTLQSNIAAEDNATNTATTHPDVGCEACCSREAIGCITSTGPQGSSWSGTGICEVSCLMKLRTMQWQDQRWWNKKEILVLAGNRLSPILRPVLVSIVLEIGPDQEDLRCSM